MRKLSNDAGQIKLGELDASTASDFTGTLFSSSTTNSALTTLITPASLAPNATRTPANAVVATRTAIAAAVATRIASAARRRRPSQPTMTRPARSARNAYFFNPGPAARTFAGTSNFSKFLAKRAARSAAVLS